MTRLLNRLAKLEQVRADGPRVARLVSNEQLPLGTIAILEVPGLGVILRVACPNLEIRRW